MPCLCHWHVSPHSPVATPTIQLCTCMLQLIPSPVNILHCSVQAWGKFCSHWKTTGKQSWKKNNKARGIIIPYFKQYYKATVIKVVLHWNKNRHINQWKGIASSEINPLIYWQLILTREPKILNGEKIVFLIKLDPSLTCPTKINSDWIKNLNIRPESIKLLEENIRKKHFDSSLGNYFLDITPKT